MSLTLTELVANARTAPEAVLEEIVAETGILACGVRTDNGLTYVSLNRIAQDELNRRNLKG